MTSPRGSATWLEEEDRLGPAFGRLIRQLLRRGSASWFIWAPLVLAISVVASVRAARRISYDATVVLGATEGSVHGPGTEITVGMLRGYVHDWAFTGDHLLGLMKRYPREFSDAAREPTNAVEEMRRATDVTVSDVAFLDDRLPDDPPRTARIAITYSSGTPELALTMARELGQLVVTSSLRRESAAIEQEQTAAAALLGKTETLFGPSGEASAVEPGGGELGTDVARAQARAEQARLRLRGAVTAATNARLATRANEENESLHFEVVDAGQLAPRRTTSLLIRDLIGILALALFATCLLAGAFDPRVLGRADVVGVGLTVLAEVPPLPAPARRRNQSAPSSPSA